MRVKLLTSNGIEMIIFFYFITLRYFIKGFIQCIRPIIVVAGAYLKGLYGRSMFVATCLDGNN